MRLRFYISIEIFYEANPWQFQESTVILHTRQVLTSLIKLLTEQQKETAKIRIIQLLLQLRQ